jgi:site-specific DNA recombinase
MKTAIYIRVSTDIQAEQGFSISAQRQRLTEYVNSQGWNLVEQFIDDGYSAKDLNRPQMQKMIQGVKEKRFDVVLVYKLDRLVRSVGDLHELLQIFDKYDCKFKSATEMFETTTAMGRFFITLVAAMASWEREQLSERVHMGMIRKHEEGGFLGGTAPYGYDLVNGEYIINEEESKWVKYIFENYDIKGGQSLSYELNKLGVKGKNGKFFTRAHIYQIINKPIYYGALRWNYKKRGKRTYEEILVPGKHEPIITKELFDKVEQIRKKRTQEKPKTHATYPFTGILRCKRCGHTMNGSKRKKQYGEYRFYKCSGRFNKGICDMPILGEKDVEKEFLENLDLSQVELEVPAEETIDEKKVEKELKKIQQRMERLEDLYIDGDISKKKYKERLEIEQKKETELTQSLNTHTNIITPEKLKELMDSVKENWNQISLEQRKRLIHTLFEFIEIECYSTHKGGHDKAIIDITDYALNK